MAVPIPTHHKIVSHLSSISLPSTSHPWKAIIEEQFWRLEASTPMCNKLGDLKDLFDSVDDMLRLPSIQQSLTSKHNEQFVEDVLEGSLKVLDACGTTRDILSQTRGCVRDLESSLRRRRKGSEAGITDEIRNYGVTQKRVSKKVSDCLRNLKNMEKKHKSNVFLGEQVTFNVLREAERTSLSCFESILLSLSQQKTKRSLVSKLIRPRRVAACEEVVLCSNFNGQKLKFEALESSLVELEDGLEVVFRRLVKIRVSVLNILSQ